MAPAESRELGEVQDLELGGPLAGAGERVRGLERRQYAFELAELLERVEPEDLLRAGLIPEFIGRLPVMVRRLRQIVPR